MKKLKWQYISALILALAVLAAGSMVAFPLWLDSPSRSNPHDPKSPLFSSAPVGPAATFTFTVTPSSTPTITATFTVSPPYTATDSPTVTGTSTASPTCTASPTASPTPTITATFTPDYAMIDDVEDGDMTILPYQGRTGTWFATSDGTDTPALTITASAPGYGPSSYAMEATGGATTPSSNWGGAIGFDFLSGGTAYDASAYTGVQVYLKAAGGTQTSVQLQVNDGTNSATQSVTLTNSWAPYVVLFSTNACLNPAAVTNFQILPATGTAADIWIDDAKFVTTPRSCVIPTTGPIGSAAWYDETIPAPNDRCFGCTIGAVDWGGGVDSAAAAHSGSIGIDWTWSPLGGPWWTGGPGVAQGYYGIGGWSDDPTKDIDITNMTTLEFWIRSGPATTAPITSFQISFNDNAATAVYSGSVNVLDCYIAPNPLPSTWTHVVIPLCYFPNYPFPGMDLTHIRALNVTCFGGTAGVDTAEVQVDDGYFRQY